MVPIVKPQRHAASPPSSSEGDRVDATRTGAGRTARAFRAATAVAGILLFVASQALAAQMLVVSRVNVGFGRVPTNVTSPVQPLFLMNTGDATLTVQSIALGGAESPQFALGGTCAAPRQLAPNERCRIDVVLRPTGTGGIRLASITIVTDASNTPVVVSVAGLNDVSTGAVAPPDPDPDWVDFGASDVGMPAPPRTVTFENNTGIGLKITSLALQTGDRHDFTLSSSCAVGDSLPHGASCAFSFGFTPGAPGLRATLLYVGLNFMDITEAVAYVSVTGVGGTLAATGFVEAVEYYHAAFDHYFITTIPDEIAKLDTGFFVGWIRTGRSINVYSAASAGLVSVCRFFSAAFAPRSSHFYTALADECTVVKANPDWTFEGDVFFVGTPAPDGSCASDTVPVYRLYNQGMGNAPNHRFTTDLQLQAQMRSLGWLAEGDGTGVSMCAAR
jgi:Repeat of unknown function (DUF5648)